MPRLGGERGDILKHMSLNTDFADATGVVPWDKAEAEALRLYADAVDAGPDPDPSDVAWVLTDLHIERIEVQGGALTVTGSVAALVPGIQRVGTALASDMARLFAEQGVTTIEKDEIVEVIAELESGILAPWVLGDHLVHIEIETRLRRSGLLVKYGVERADVRGLYVEERALSTGVEPAERIRERLQHELDLVRSERYRATAVGAGLSDADALRMWREDIPVELAVPASGN